MYRSSKTTLPNTPNLCNYNGSKQAKKRMNQQRKDEPTLQERKYLSENGKITLLQTEFQMSEGLVLFRN